MRAGRLLDLPAIDDDGKALWPEQYDFEARWRKIKLAIGAARLVGALPAAAGARRPATISRPNGSSLTSHPPARETMRVYGGSDYAVTADGGDYTGHVVVGIDPEGRMYLLDLWRKQAASDEWVEAFCDLVKMEADGWAEETGQIKSGVGPFLEKRACASANLCGDESNSRPEATRPLEHSPFAAGWRWKGCMFRLTRLGMPICEASCLSFPAGKHDDQVDASRWTASGSDDQGNAGQGR
jgi:hypothetical protein